MNVLADLRRHRGLRRVEWIVSSYQVRDGLGKTVAYPLPSNATCVNMVSTSDILTLVSSVALRLSVWVFLRWVRNQRQRMASNDSRANMSTDSHHCQFPRHQALDSLDTSSDTLK